MAKPKTIAAGKINLELHPKAKSLVRWLRLLESKEAKELKADIKEHGVQLPILLTNDGKQIIDGRNRWNIAHELELKQVPVEYYKGKDDDIEKIIWSRNVLRRHLTDDQRDQLRDALIAPQLEKEAKARKKAGVRPSHENHEKVGGKSDTFGGCQPIEEGGSVADQVAEQLNITRHRADQLEKVRKSGMAKAVISGKRKLKDAAKDAPKKERVKKPKSKIFAPDQLGTEVYRKFHQLLRHFDISQWRAVKDHIRNFLGGEVPEGFESNIS